MEYNALYIQLMNRILDKMRRGEYQVGDKMDSERVMAQQYGINRQTVRKAARKRYICSENTGKYGKDRAGHNGNDQPEYADPAVRI